MTETNFEGQYFAFNFEADYTEGGTALAVFKVTQGQLLEVFHPCDNTGSELILSVGDRETTKAIEFLKANGVSEIFSTWETGNPERKDILGKKMSWYHDEDNWGGYTGIYDEDGYWTQLLNSNGIELKLFTN